MEQRSTIGSRPGTRITLANWRRPPWNRWSYQHTRELIPTANVSRGEGAVWRLCKRDFDLAGLTFRSPSTDVLSVVEFLDHSWTDAMVVLNRGEIVVEEYRNGMKADTRHLSMSVGKSITSLVFGTLAGRKLVETTARITDYLPELAGSACEGATIQHALDMEVANGWYGEDPNDTFEYSRLEAACGWVPPRPGAPASVFDFMLETRSDGRHGERTWYSDLNPDALGMIAERVTGSRFGDIVSEALWTPAGMEFDADITLDPAGFALADGGYCIAARDFARIGLLTLAGGMAGGRHVVPEEWIAEYRTPNPKPFHDRSYGSSWPGASYHNQWWQMDGRLYAIGVHGQMIAVDHGTQTVVVFLSSAPEPNNVTQHVVQRSIVDAICAAMPRVDTSSGRV